MPVSIFVMTNKLEAVLAKRCQHQQIMDIRSPTFSILRHICSSNRGPCIRRRRITRNLQHCDSAERLRFRARQFHPRSTNSVADGLTADREPRKSVSETSERGHPSLGGELNKYPFEGSWLAGSTSHFLYG